MQKAKTLLSMMVSRLLVLLTNKKLPLLLLRPLLLLMASHTMLVQVLTTVPTLRTTWMWNSPAAIALWSSQSKVCSTLT